MPPPVSAMPPMGTEQHLAADAKSVPQREIIGSFTPKRVHVDALQDT